MRTRNKQNATEMGFLRQKISKMRTDKIHNDGIRRELNRELKTQLR